MKCIIAISTNPSNKAMADSHQSAIAYQKEHLRDSRKAEIIAPIAVFLAIAYVAVFFRYKSRRVAHLKLGPDDLCIGIGLVRSFCQPLLTMY